MTPWILWCLLLLTALPLPAAQTAGSGSVQGRVCVIPIREDIGTPLVFLVRRGVKMAIQGEAEVLVLDMDTNGGSVDRTEEIIEILGQFKGRTLTYVNRRAFSAGAFIALATQKIYMAPEGVIGAAAPIMVGPGGGVENLNPTVEAKMSSAVAAMVRASAEKNGHNLDVADAMVRKSRALVIEGEVLNKEGEILTLTSQGAAKRYGNPPKPLLSAGTFPTLDDLLKSVESGVESRIVVEPTGWEQVGSFLGSQAVASLLLLAGIVGLYIEFKTPGFGLPGILGLTSFGLYFLGGYIAGLSGAGWALVFFLGVVCVGLELFVFPGTFVAGITGVLLMIVSLVMALVDTYPKPGSLIPSLPEGDFLLLPAKTVVIAFLGAAAAIAILNRFLPKTSLYGHLVSHTASGSATELAFEHTRQALLGREGVTTSALRPGGKGRFGDEWVDVISRGEMIDKGVRVKIVGFSGVEAVVEPLT